MTKFQRAATRLLAAFNVRSIGRYMFFGFFVGVVAGLGAVAFYVLCQLGQHLLLDGLAGYRPGGPHGEIPLFGRSALTFSHPFELGPYTALAVVVGLASPVYVKCFYGAREIFAGLKIANYCKPAVGGLLAGCVGFFIPETLAFGYGVIQDALRNEIAVGLVVAQPGAFVIVGMAGLFSAASNAPISTIIMVSEMTGNYNLLVPAMWVCAIAYIISRRWSIYENQVPTRVDSPAHYGDFVKDVLEEIHVRDVLVDRGLDDLLVVKEIAEDAVPAAALDDSLAAVLRLLTEHEVDALPVVGGGDEMRLIGMVRRRDVLGSYCERLGAAKRARAGL